MMINNIIEVLAVIPVLYIVFSLREMWLRVQIISANSKREQKSVLKSLGSTIKGIVRHVLICYKCFALWVSLPFFLMNYDIKTAVWMACATSLIAALISPQLWR